MTCTRIPLAEMPWIGGGHPLERKKTDPEHGVTLIEFAPGFVDPEWCQKGHVLLVLEGVLELDLGTAVERFGAGDAASIDPGTKHRAKNPGSAPVRLFVVSR